MRRLLMISLLVLASFGFVAWLQAAVVQPEAVTLAVEPGEKVHQTVYFENDSSVEQTYSLDVASLSFGSSADDLRFGSLEQSRRAWIDLDRSSFTLASGASQAVEATITVPDDISSEVFTFAIVATTQADITSGVGVTSGVASLFFIQIGPDAGSQLMIDSFSTVPDNTHKLPVKFAVLVTNQGEGLAEPEIGIVIKNMWGHELTLISLNPTGRRIPGHTNRVFSADWTASPWHFGPYTAEVYIFPNNSDAVITATTSVVLFPWQMLCVLAAIVLIFGGSIYAYAQARRR